MCGWTPAKLKITWILLNWISSEKTLTHAFYDCILKIILKQQCHHLRIFSAHIVLSLQYITGSKDMLHVSWGHQKRAQEREDTMHINWFSHVGFPNLKKFTQRFQVWKPNMFENRLICITTVLTDVAVIHEAFSHSWWYIAKLKQYAQKRCADGGTAALKLLIFFLLFKLHTGMSIIIWNNGVANL